MLGSLIFYRISLWASHLLLSTELISTLFDGLKNLIGRIHPSGRQAANPIAGRYGLDVQHILKNLTLFSHLTPKQSQILSHQLVPRQFKAEEIIIQRGNKGLGMYILLSGQAEVYNQDEDNHIHLATLGRGTSFGEMALIDGHPRSANVRALETCQALLLTRDSFNKLIEKDPQILWGIASVMAERLRQDNEKITQLHLPDQENHLPPSGETGSGAVVPSESIDEELRALRAEIAALEASLNEERL